MIKKRKIKPGCTIDSLTAHIATFGYSVHFVREFSPKDAGDITPERLRFFSKYRWTASLKRKGEGSFMVSYGTSAYDALLHAVNTFYVGHRGGIPNGFPKSAIYKDRSDENETGTKSKKTKRSDEEYEKARKGI